MIVQPTKLTARAAGIQLVIVTGLITFASISASAQIPKLNSFAVSRNTVYLDFDGQTVAGTSWNWDSTIHARPAGLNSTQITEIFNRVAEDYRIFNINITTDPAVYSKAPVDKRVRLILTPTYRWYGAAGGVAFVNSFTWGDDTPAWVFTTLLSNNPKYIGEAASHEVGHTLGLQHQSTYTRNCDLVVEYAEGKGTGEIGWAPIMGVGYYKNYTTWTYGTSIEGCRVQQNDIGIISNGLNHIGMRVDDYGNSRTTAANLTIANNKFQVSGLINGAPDKDFFKVVLAKKSRLTITATPYSVAAGNNGANLDVLMTLIKYTGDTLLRANPKTLLGAAIDTVLFAGIYYIGIDGVSNVNVSDYGSAGSYFVAGTIVPLVTTVSSSVIVRGDIKSNMHVLNWTSDNTQPVAKAYLEYSFNGMHFIPVAELPESVSTYEYQPPTTGNIYYRVRMKLPDDSYYYSNTIMLSSGTLNLVSNVVRGSIQLNALGEYQYQLFDEMGRMYQNGKVNRGMNIIPVNQVKNGLLLMKVFNRNQQYVFKLIKQ